MRCSEGDPSGQSNWTSDWRSNSTPNNTIVIRGLAQHITENDVSLSKSQYTYVLVMFLLCYLVLT